MDRGDEEQESQYEQYFREKREKEEKKGGRSGFSSFSFPFAVGLAAAAPIQDIRPLLCASILMKWNTNLRERGLSLHA